MQDFHNLEHPALLDMLSLYTVRYTKMLSDRVPKDESEACRKIIQDLQAEIEIRKNPGYSASKENV